MVRVFICLLLLCSVAGRDMLCRDSSDSSETKDARDPTSDGHDSSDQDYIPRLCDGRGTQYCTGNYAVTVKDCPDACKGCENDSSGDQDEIAREELYDYVFVYNDGLCLSGCNDLDKMRCGDWDTYEGEKYCKYVSCKSGTSINGCHSRSDFARPSCRVCATVFPHACNPEGGNGGDSSDSDSSGGGWFWNRFVSYSRIPGWTEAFKNLTNSTVP